MVPTEIERDVLIDAPIETVWRVLTEPQHLRAWFAQDVDLDFRPGWPGTIDFVDGDHIAKVAIVMEAVEPPHRLAYRWEFPEGETAPREGNSTLVEFLLSTEGTSTRLRVLESGLGAMPWTEDHRAAFVADHTGGWTELLGNLERYAPTPEATAAR